MSYMAFDIEQFFQSIDIILTQRLSDLSYNTTVIATVVDDSDKEKGHYIVSDGTIKFDAYSSDVNYKIDDQVRVTILNGDWSQKKFIEGKYTDGDSTSAISYIPPLGTIMQDNQSTLDTISDFVLYANYSNPITVWSQQITPDSDYYTLQENGIYNVITLQGNFQTELDSAALASGNYGLLLELFIQPEVGSNTRIRKYITFDSSEMIGNPYSFVIDSHQAKQITMTSGGIVTEMILSIYQAREYSINENQEFVTNITPFTLRKNNAPLVGAEGDNAIWFKNITIGFGSDLTQVQDNSLKLYTTSSTSYSYNNGVGDDTNDKYLGFVWYNKSEDNEYVGFSDGIYDVTYDEIQYREDSWVDNRLLAQKGKSNIPTDVTSLALAANIADSQSYMTRAYKALTTDLSSVLQSLSRQLVGTSLVEELNRLIRSTNEDALLVQKQQIAQTNAENLIAMYSGVLEYGYNIQNDTGEANWNEAWGDADYFNAFKQAFRSDDSQGALDIVETFMQSLKEQTAVGQTLSGYRGIYNAYNFKVNKVIDFIESYLDSIIHTVGEETPIEDIEILKTYKDKTEYIEYGATDFSDCANKYSIYWYRYHKGYVEQDEHEAKYANFLGDDWERVQVDSNNNTLVNFGIPTEPGETTTVQLEDGTLKEITYYPNSPSEAQILYRRMNPVFTEERYQVVLFYNHKMIKSNIITFENIQADQIPPSVLVDVNDTLKIEHGAYSQDHYQSYSSAYDLINIADESRSRQLRVSYDGVLAGDEALAGAGIYWYVPTNSTMLTYDKNYLINNLKFDSDSISSTTLTLTGVEGSIDYTYTETLPTSFNLVGGKVGTKTIEAWDSINKIITLNKTLGEISEKQVTVKGISNTTPQSRNGYVYFYKEIKYSSEEVDAKDADGNIIYGADGMPVKEIQITLEEADRHFAYKIKPYYEASAQNNTIKVEAHINNAEGEESIITGEISFTFSTFGTNGTKYTFVMTPATTQIATLNDSDAEDDIIDGSLDLKLSLRDADNNLIPMTTNPIGIPGENGDIEEYEIDAYFLTVGWHGAPPQERRGDIVYNQTDTDKWWNVDVALSTNDNYYQGIIKAQVQYNAEGKTSADTRIIQLSSLYPVPYASSENFYIAGPTAIVYNNQGTISRYNDEPFKLYSRYVDSGEKDSDGNIIFNENVEVEDQHWTLLYYKNDGTQLTAANDAYAAIVSYMPTLNSDNTIMPAPMYYLYEDGVFYVPVAVCKDSLNNILWSQPIVITQNQYASSTLNDWNGCLEIDEANGTILSTMIGAGVKTEQNTFEGVLMGDIEAGANFDSDNANGIGIYGFNDGAQSFHFGINGKAFLGKSGRGRIKIDGNKGTITSASYEQLRESSSSGMLIDLDDGIIDMYGVNWNPEDNSKYEISDTHPHIRLSTTATQGNPYFLITTPNITFSENADAAEWVDKALIYVGLDGYYLQSENYEPGTYFTEDAKPNEPGVGTKIDLQNGRFDAYNLLITSKNIYIDSTEGADPYFMIKDWDGHNLFYAGDSDYYLKTCSYKARTVDENGNVVYGSGIKIDLLGNKIDAYDFMIRGEASTGSTAGSYILLDSTTPQFTVHLKNSSADLDLLHVSPSDFMLHSSNWSTTTKDETDTTTTAITAGGYNIRSGAGTNYSVVGSSTAGKKVTIYEGPVEGEGASGWYRIGDGQWIAASALSDISTNSTVSSTTGAGMEINMNSGKITAYNSSNKNKSLLINSGNNTYPIQLGTISDNYNLKIGWDGSLRGGTTYDWSIKADGTATFNRLNANGGSLNWMSLGSATITKATISSGTIGGCTISSGSISGSGWSLTSDKVTFNNLYANSITMDGNSFVAKTIYYGYWIPPGTGAGATGTTFACCTGVSSYATVTDINGKNVYCITGLNYGNFTYKGRSADVICARKDDDGA